MRRYSDCRELGDDLRRFLAGDPVEARQLGWLSRACRLVFHTPRVTMLSAGGFSTGIASIFLAAQGIGWLSLVSGADVVKNEFATMLASSVVIAAVSLPMLVCGLGTLSGRRLALGSGTCVFLVGLLGSLATLTGTLPAALQLDVFERVLTSGFVGFQLSSFLSSTFVLGLTVHLIAWVCQEPKASLQQPEWLQG